jgi:sensor histidine kinase YesM
MEKSSASNRRNILFDTSGRLSIESRIVLRLFLIIYLVFTLLQLILFSGQSLIWHLGIGVLGLLGLLLFGFIVWVIDAYLDKKIPFEKNVVKRISIQFLLTVTIITVIRAVTGIFVVKMLPIKVSPELIAAGFAINVFMILSLVLSIFAYRFFKGWREEKLLAAVLEREKAQVQYDNLKNQLNPHFLFNSLTSLNSLIFENPQLASEFLQQLSKVYRYVLDNKDKNLVTLDTEVAFVKHYVQLLKARFENGLDVSFEIGESARQKAIVPVTLQILIENAIKHNITQKSNPLQIRIFNNGDYVQVANNLQLKKVIEGSNGQGLENLKNLYYFLSGKAVIIEEHDKSFNVKIPLLDL